MGSGFLVCAPLLYANVGNYAVIAMLGLLALAYCVGAVIRFNIRYAEPLLETACPVQSPEREEHRLHKAHCAAGSRVQAGEAAQLLEKASYFALAGAYCISVSYYLQLLASFALQPLGSLSPLWGKGLVTLILVGIGAVGLLRGLKGIERLERVVVGINLAMIGALMAGLLYHNLLLAGQGGWRLASTSPQGDGLHILRVLMGMLVVVQGFETSRYLGSEHSREERVRSMRLAQGVSSAIYVAFIGLMAVVISNDASGGRTGITAIVEYSLAVAPVLPLLITVTALGSQFSAATADDAGCSGLLESIFGRWLPVKYDYVVVSAVSIVLTWMTDVYQIISVASRAFALYYVLQCAVAVLVARRSSVAFPVLRQAAYGALGAVCLAVALFGIPAG
jgi:hypothetical protein